MPVFLYVCNCVCVYVSGLGLTQALPHRQSDTFVLQDRTRQPPVRPAPPHAQGTVPCTCKPHPALTCVAWLACTLVAVDFVDALPIVAGLALAVVKVYLAVETCELEQK